MMAPGLGIFVPPYRHIAGTFVLGTVVAFGPGIAFAEIDFITPAIDACTNQESQDLSPLVSDLEALGWEVLTDDNRSSFSVLADESFMFYDLQKGLTPDELKLYLEEIRADAIDPLVPPVPADPSKPSQSLHHSDTPESLLLVYPKMGILYCEFVIADRNFDNAWLTEFLAMATKPDAPYITGYFLQDYNYIPFQVFTYTPYGEPTTLSAPEGEANISVDIADIDAIRTTVPDFNVRAIIQIAFNPVYDVVPSE